MSKEHLQLCCKGTSIEYFKLDPHKHYVRKAHSRRARMKNGDMQIARLHRRVLDYRVIGDAQPGASSITIHGRRATSVHVTYLISG
jgi:hypothetical protein